MRNSYLPAMPQDRDLLKVVVGVEPMEATGLTKREMFAMHAMQGILANVAKDEIGYNKWEENLAERSVEVADAVLWELEK